MHEKAHSDEKEKRDGKLIVRGLRIHSVELGLSGQCDVVEFQTSDDGVHLDGRDGKFIPYPIEYKRGSPKQTDEDKVQLCAQAMCLEEMLATNISHGALYYGEIRRREVIDFSEELRKTVRDSANEMQAYFSRGYTPKVKTGTKCRRCSLSEICLPKLMRVHSVADYLEEICENS